MSGYTRLGNNRNFVTLRKEKEAQMLAQEQARRELSAARKVARPILRGSFAGYRQNRAGNIESSIYGGIGGKAAANFGQRRPGVASARALTAIGGFGAEYAKGRNNRNAARVNVQLAVNRLIGKSVGQWNKNDRSNYMKYRSRYQNAVNQVVRSGGAIIYNNKGKPRSMLRGMARLREVGRGARASLRNKLGAARMYGRTGLSAGRYAANLAAAAGARGYGSFARGLGKAAGYGYRAGHAMGNYPRAALIAQRAPTAASVNEAVTKYNRALARAANSPTPGNVSAALAAGTRAQGLLARASP